MHKEGIEKGVSESCGSWLHCRKEQCRESREVKVRIEGGVETSGLCRERQNQDSVIAEGGAQIWVTLRCRDAERTAATTAAQH